MSGESDLKVKEAILRLGKATTTTLTETSFELLFRKILSIVFIKHCIRVTQVATKARRPLWKFFFTVVVITNVNIELHALGLIDVTVIAL